MVRFELAPDSNSLTFSELVWGMVWWWFRGGLGWCGGGKTLAVAMIWGTTKCAVVATYRLHSDVSELLQFDRFGVDKLVNLQFLTAKVKLSLIQI